MNLSVKICRPFCLTFLLSILASNSIAATKEQSLTENTYKALSKAHEMMEQNKYSKAMDKLTAYLNSNSVKTYDNAVVQQTLGYIHNALGNHDEAIDAFKKALLFDVLPDDVSHQLTYQIAQLAIYKESYKEGLKYLDIWFGNEPDPKPDAHLLAATAYYYLKNYQQMIPHAEKAIAKSNSAPLMWYELLLAGYYETRQFKKTIPVLTEIIEKYPGKKNFWMQLINSYQLTKNDKKALATFELAYKKRMLKQSEIIQLAKNYLYMEMPYQAGKLLQYEIENNHVDTSRENLELLANSWILSQEYAKAEEVLLALTQLANIEAYPRLAQLYVDREDWKGTYTLLKPLINELTEKHDSKVYLYFGIAAFHLEKYSESRSALSKALSSGETNELAKWWLKRIDKQDS